MPGIHDLLCRQDVDGRDKPGHDGGAAMAFATHCHGKRRQIKPERPVCSVKPYWRAIVLSFSSRSSIALAQIIAAAAEGGVALADEVALPDG